MWALIVGALLTTAALSGTLLKRLPLSITMFYLAAGYGLGPAGLDWIAINPMTHAVLLERLAEVAVLISLFAVGLKLGLPLSNKAWQMPLRLAVTSMMLTIAMVAVVGLALGLSLGAAILLGAILAFTSVAELPSSFFNKNVRKTYYSRSRYSPRLSGCKYADRATFN